MKETFGKGSAWAAVRAGQPDDGVNDVNRHTQVCIEFLRNIVRGVLEFFEQCWRDGEEINTGKGFDLSRLIEKLIG
jgi:hypothetical protein